VNGKDVSAVVAAMDRNVQSGLSEVLESLDKYFWLCTRIRRGPHFKPLSEER